MRKAFAIFIFITCALACKQGASPKTKAAASFVVLQLPSGWGYNIYKEGKLFIRQEQVPAVQGTVPFASEQDAAAVAKEVVKKLNLGESPRITVAELQRLGVKH
jgi:hypothetical protein